MRSEHYYLPTVETAYSVGISSLGLFLYPRIATRFTRLVLSHLERRIVALTVVAGLRVVIIPITLHCD